MATSDGAARARSRRIVNLARDEVVGKFRRMLIIDDEVKYAESIGEALKDAGGYTYAVAGSLASAAETLSARRFPLIICDNIFENRPGEKGSEFIRDQHALMGGASVVLLTGYPLRQIVDADILEGTRGVRIVKKGVDVVDDLRAICEEAVQERAERFSQKLENVIEAFLDEMDDERDLDDLMPGPGILRRARTYLLDYLSRLPRQEEGQFYISGKTLSPRELIQQIELGSEVGGQVLEMVLADSFEAHDEK